MSKSTSDPSTSEQWKEKKLLIVDDDDTFRKHLRRALARREFDVFCAANYDGAMVILDEISVDFAVVDLRMPGNNGLQLLRDMFDIRPDVDAIVLTGYGSIATAVDAVRLGAINYIQKPADADDIVGAFERGKQPPLEEASHSFAPPSLERAEWEHIQRVLSECGRNISKAARQLGIHRRTLQRKLDRAAPISSNEDDST